jgi:Na+/H+ antiporter NhaD/arsenite permease-like protein
MAGGGEPASLLIFGLSPFWVSTVLFAVTYALIITDWVNRAIVALLGAALMISLGVLNQADAIRGIDFNTLGLLTGMMLVVAITRRCGVFQYVAIWSAKKVNADPWGILVMLAVVTASFSALLDNITTVLLIVPVTLLITEELGVKPYPYLVTEVLSSNIGGTATLIGDPPNIMIGSATKLTFVDFLWHLTPIVPLIMLVTLGAVYIIWGRRLSATPEARRRIMQFDERQAITDEVLLKQSLSVLGLVVVGFILAHLLHIEPATIALFGAAALLLLTNLGHKAEDQTKSVHTAFTEVEWVTIFFFVGLFVVVHGIETAGVLDWLGEEILHVTRGDLQITAMAVLWASACLSAVVDNIPFVATMIPLIKSLAPNFGGSEQLLPLWWALALGACLGGNGTLIGASANLIVAGLSERAGHRISFLRFTLAGFPLMLLSIAMATIYLYLRYL